MTFITRNLNFIKLKRLIRILGLHQFFFFFFFGGGHIEESTEQLSTQLLCVDWLTAFHPIDIECCQQAFIGKNSRSFLGQGALTTKADTKNLDHLSDIQIYH